jgi:hypothetical protein
MEYVSMVKGWAFFSLLLVSPLPALLAGFIYLSKRPYSLRRLTMGLSVGWCIFQAAIAFILGSIISLTYGYIFISQILLLLIGVGLLSRIEKSSLRELAGSIQNLNFGIEEKILLISICLIGFIFWYQISSQPISDFDSLYYHLPMTVNWFQTGSLERLPEFGQNSQYPYNWELLATLFIFPFHTDFQVLFVNMIAWFLFGVSVVVLSVELGAKRLPSIFVASIVMLIPITRTQLNSLHVDLTFVGFFLTSLYFLLDFLRTRDMWSLNLFFASVGMMLGVKMSGLGYVILLVVCGIGIWFDEKSSRKFDQKNLYTAIPGFIFMCALGGYWYIANWLEVGNPLGYLKVSAGPVVIFKGLDMKSYLAIIHPQFYELTPLVQQLYDDCENLGDCIPRTTLMSVFNPMEKEDWQILWLEIRSQGGWQLFLIVALVPFGIYNLAKQRGFRSGIMVSFILVLLGSLLLFLLTPYSGDNGSHQWQITPWIGQAFRYALPFFGVLSIISALGFSILTPPKFSFVVFFILLTFVFLPELAVIFAILTFIIVMSNYLKLKGLHLNHHLLMFSFFVLCILVFTILSYGKYQREKLQADQFNGLESVFSTYGQKKIKIGYIASFFRYPLYGIHLDHEVFFTPAYSDHREQWIESLRKRDIQLVSIGPFRDEDWLKIREFAWLNDPNGPFERISGLDPRDEFVLFKLEP